VLVAYAVVARRSKDKAATAVKAGAKQLRSIAPTFLAVFGLVGLFEGFVPPSLIERWLGTASGVTSLLVGAGVGSVAAGPPPAAFPLAATLLKGGAWPPAIAAFIVAWVLVGVVSLPFEAKTFGWRFALLRNGLSFVAACVIGLGVGMVL
jgi:uncharacterized membrane protein YraQ (UPF0718 family)